jgi:FO synthase
MGPDLRLIAELLDAPLDELMVAARARAVARFGRRITYSPKVFIPLTQLCRDRCEYCCFAQAPARVPAPYLEMEQVLALARRGEAAGCREALFTLGERPEARYRVAERWLSDRGFDSTVAYLAEAARVVSQETGLLVHTNAGALSEDELAMLRPVAVSQGMMVETLRPDLPAHRHCPDKEPGRRLATLEAAGRLAIPFTTGVLVGIGETRADVVEALLAIARSHERHRHIQEVIVQNFRPKPATAMRQWPACDPQHHLFAVAAARMILDPDISVQAPPNLVDEVADLIEAGVNDLGGISPVTMDHVNPERAWPHLDRLSDQVGECGRELVSRLAIQPSYALEPDRWVDPAIRPRLLAQVDSLGLARDDWFAGGASPPPPPRSPGSGARGAVAEAIDGVLAGQVPGDTELAVLFGARGGDLEAVCQLADQLRAEARADEVTFVRNRNINYTNICTFKCRFCAFSKGPRSLNLRGDPYLLSLEEIAERARQAADAGATEVCLQGGIHPRFDGEYYLSVVQAVRRAVPDIHIHAFSALEVWEGARRLKVELFDYLVALRRAGLASLPGTAAEILDDRVRSIICKDKLTTDQWLEVHEQAHEAGLRSNVTIMFGAVERPDSWVRHLLVTRDLQRRTGGFTEFVPLPFVHFASPIFLEGRSRRGPTFAEALLMHAVGRIAYHGLISNIQTSWVKMGLAGAARCLEAGANDLGGTLMDENISRAAGASHGQAVTEAELAAVASRVGRPLVQRSTFYGREVPSGAR